MADAERKFCSRLSGAIEDEESAESVYMDLAEQAKKMENPEVRSEMLEIAADEIEHREQLEQIDTVVCE